METCLNHPEKEAVYHCLKYNRYYCKDCLTCRDPKIYCKFRTSCIIWFTLKKKKLD